MLGFKRSWSGWESDWIGQRQASYYTKKQCSTKILSFIPFPFPWANDIFMVYRSLTFFAKLPYWSAEYFQREGQGSAHPGHYDAGYGLIRLGWNVTHILL